MEEPSGFPLYLHPLVRLVMDETSIRAKQASWFFFGRENRHAENI